MTDDNIVHLPLKMPLPLARQVARLSLPADPAMASFPAAPPEHDPAASEWLQRKRALIKQASRDDCHDWLIMLAHGLNGMSQEVLERREFAIWSMCRDLPDLVWCEATMHAMWARTAFLPTPGECRDVLSAQAAPLLREIEALEQIASVPPPTTRVTVDPPYVPPPAPEWALNGPEHSDGLVLGSQKRWATHAPIRTVEEQIAAMRQDVPPMQTDAKNSFAPANDMQNVEPNQQSGISK